MTESIDTLLSMKIGLIFIVFALMYIGLIPAYSTLFRNSKTALSLMNCFAGGVFLAMALMHILPDSVAEYYTVKLALIAEETPNVASNATIVETE